MYQHIGNSNKLSRCLSVVLVFFLMLAVLIPCAAPAAAASDQVVVIASISPSVHSGAGSGHSKLGNVRIGEVYDYLGESRDSSGITWYKIQYSSGKTGWVKGDNTIRTARSTDCTQKMIDKLAKYYGAVGVQIAVVEKGLVTDTFNYGWATKGSRKMDSDCKIRVASLSKVAVAINAMKMQEQGIIDINKSIGSYWGCKPYKAVTLKSLLSHTSTLRDMSYTSKSGTVSRLKSSGSYVKGAVGSPGSWFYNNYAVGVAGGTLEVASGRTLSNYALNNVFQPLGMDASFSSGLLKNTSKLATLYYSGGSVARSVSTAKSLKGSSTPGANTSLFAGGLTCSAKDYARLIAMLANDGTYDGVRILSPESVAVIETRLFTKSEHGGSFSQCMPLRYKANLYGQSSLYYHTGNAYGVLALASYNPSTGNGVVVVTTGASAARDAQGVYRVCSSMSEFLYRYRIGSFSGGTASTTTTTTPSLNITTSTSPDTTVTTHTTTQPDAPEVLCIRMSGKDRFATASEICSTGWTRSEYVYLANGNSYADALAGVPLAALDKAPILLTANRPEGIESDILTQLSRLETETVVILGGESVVSTLIQQQLTAAGYITERVSGSSRYETSLEIAIRIDRKGVRSGEVFCVSGENFPDALSAGSPAGLKGVPIVYVPSKGSAHRETLDYLSGSGKSTYYFVGGESAVTQSVIDSITADSSGYAERICGTDRYSTSLAVFRRFSDLFGSVTCVSFATGENFPDALTGSAFAANSRIPLLLVSNTRSSGELAEYLNDRYDISSIYAFGDDSVVSDGILRSIFAGLRRAQ